VERWAINNGLTINTGKTKVMVFSKRKSNNTPSSVYLCNTKLEQVSEFTYLGVTLSDRLTYETNYTQGDSKIERSIYLLPAAFQRLDLLPLERLRDLYNSCVLSSALYGAELWGIYRRDIITPTMIRAPCRFLKRAIQLPQPTSHDLLYREC